ncbi:allophanate hydrolase subunit 2-domain-containing protein [Phyllosticta citriasiana]|uniref:Allophanate hydrolase subunit 2-domain-containing protein n=1 Tax=Phyllosticta citriasiana TaxID=595635 RepID=A0ABR1L3B6_9PEZI
MEAIKTLLIANRGEIAVRIIRTAKLHHIHTIAIYSSADAASLHVSLADTAIQLPSPSPSSAYTDTAAIIDIARRHRADAIIPGYGFLSENAAFARAVRAAGIAWVGPGPDAIEAFGVKHVARDLARAAGVPIVPGSPGLVRDADEAAQVARELGFPVMLKATGGGGGMGLLTCADEDEVRAGFAIVRSRGETLFKEGGVFLERFYAESRHVEVQVFGNGAGRAVHFGERECSIQRRHQKVVEECPSPFVEKRPELREKLGSAAVLLAKSIKYGSAGTVEFLVDDKTGDFFFLEMNTRLQVEHGITELCYGVDLVEMMLKQADAERAGKGGFEAEYLESLQPSGPKGAAIEVRVYAENPVRDFAPSPGLLQQVSWKEVPGTRIDTWVFTGARITPNYDPLIAKAMVHAPTRDEAIDKIQQVLSGSQICGPPTNLEFLEAITRDANFKAGHTLTSFLKTFDFAPHAIDVVFAGAYTLVQDLPARPAVGKGIPHSGPMDPLAFQIANLLVGNPRGKEGLEMTLSGPELLFIGPAVVALCGASMEATLDGAPFPMWTRKTIAAGQKLKIGKTTGGGCRSYLAIYGGLPGVADYFGSKSTSPSVGLGGYQGRPLAPGDFLQITREMPSEPATQEISIPEQLRPVYTNDWKIKAMSGPHDDGFLTPEDVEMIYSTVWKVSHNASRTGIRLVGPIPKWARSNGGEGGAHPSNLVEYGYPLGALDWTGDDPCILPVDCPNFGGFVSSTTVVRGDWWKLGQIKAGDRLQYERVSLGDALELRERLERFLESLEKAVEAGGKIEQIEQIEPFDAHSQAPSTAKGEWDKAVLWHRPQEGNLPAVTYRQGGDDHIIVEYGNQNFDLNHRSRVTKLESLLRDPSKIPYWLHDSLITTMGCCTTLTLFYNGAKLPRDKLISQLQAYESQLGDLSSTKIPCRRFKLPISFSSPEQREAVARYMETQRPHAPYLPDNLAFVARNNGLEPQDLVKTYLTGTFVAVCVGFYCGNTVCLPADPRHRMNCPKQNPSRVYTPAGTVSWGGSCMSLYPVDSPGGYQMTGRTVPSFDALGWRKGCSPVRPWVFQDWDLLTYSEVSEEEMGRTLAQWEAGLYEWQWEDVLFDVAEHNELLKKTQDEVVVVRERQRKANARMMKAEQESLAKWREEKSKVGLDKGTVDKLLDDPAIVAIEAPVDANVWKVEVADGDGLEPNHLVSILEAMKLEIAVRLPDDVKAPAKIEKVLVKPGETVSAGAKIALVRRG